MAEDIFKAVSMKAGDTKKSYQWYRDQVRNLGSSVSGTQMLGQKQLTNNISVSLCMILNIKTHYRIMI